MPDIDHAGFHRGVGKSWESNMCHSPASTILLLTLCQWCRTLYNTPKAIQENQDATINAFAVICGPIIPLAGSGCCRISCRYSLVLRKMPGIDGAGSQYLPLQYLQYPLLNYKLHLKHECQYNTYLILVLRCQE